VEALDSIAKMIEGRSESEFLQDEILCYAVAHGLTVVGGAASRVSPEMREKYSTIPWADVIALRNILVHEYFGIHWPLVWQTVVDHAPVLGAQVRLIVDNEFRP
jgi:uncharacterized protein with HEPN domain